MADLLHFQPRQTEDRGIAGALDAYLAHLEKRRAATTAAAASAAFAKIAAHCAANCLDLATLTPGDLERWHAAQASPVAANRAMQYLRAAWNRAIVRGDLPAGSNPVQGFDSWRAQERPRTTVLSDEALAYLLQKIAAQRASPRERGPFRFAPVLLILLTGMRRGEVEALTWANVKPGRLELADSKTGARMVGLSAEAERLIEECRPAAVDPDAKVFAGIDLRRAWESLRKRANCQHVTLHDLRRTFAVRLLESGAVDLTEVAKQLGHGSTRITSGVYTPLQVRRASELAEKAAQAILAHQPAG